VAVNDLGRVSYRNDSYVLDLFGLASLEALRARVHDTDAEWVNGLARRHDVKLAMVYPGWFHFGMPPDWEKVAELRLSRGRVTAADETVAFYTLGPEAREEVVAELQRFRQTLPPGVALVIAPGSEAGAPSP
jgi:hypothetical protein